MPMVSLMPGPVGLQYRLGVAQPVRERVRGRTCARSRSVLGVRSLARARPGPRQQRDEGHDLIAEGGHDQAFGSAHFRAHFRAHFPPLDRGHGQFLG